MSTPRSESLPPYRTRLHKFLASAGVDSRRKCEQLMLEGRVTVDGEEIRDLAYMVEPARQQVRVDGEIVREQPKHYFMINKPKGYVCTHYDPEGRPRAVDLVPIEGLALFTIGRLDEDSDGLLLVTNDGLLAEKLAHPRFRVERVYRVQVAGQPGPEILDQLKRGMFFEEGKFRVLKVRVLKSQGRSTWLEVVLAEGKNREIRRLLARVGHKVLNLQRVAFGPIRLGALPLGEFRVLTARELIQLKGYVAGKRRATGTRLPRPPAPTGTAATGGEAVGTSEAASGPSAGGERPRRPFRPRQEGGPGGPGGRAGSSARRGVGRPGGLRDSGGEFARGGRAGGSRSGGSRTGGGSGGRAGGGGYSGGGYSRGGESRGAGGAQEGRPYERRSRGGNGGAGPNSRGGQSRPPRPRGPRPKQ